MTSLLLLVVTAQQSAEEGVANSVGEQTVPDGHLRETADLMGTKEPRPEIADDKVTERLGDVSFDGNRDPRGDGVALHITLAEEALETNLGIASSLTHLHGGVEIIANKAGGEQDSKRVRLDEDTLEEGSAVGEGQADTRLPSVVTDREVILSVRGEAATAGNDLVAASERESGTDDFGFLSLLQRFKLRFVPLQADRNSEGDRSTLLGTHSLSEIFAQVVRRHEELADGIATGCLLGCGCGSGIDGGERRDRGHGKDGEEAHCG